MQRHVDVERELATIRAELERERAAQVASDNAPAPRAVAIARIEEEIARKAATIELNGGAYAAPPALYDRRYLAELVAGEGDAILAYLFPEQLTQKHIAALDRYYLDHPPGPPAEKREADRAARARRLLALEVREEQLIRDAEAAGLTIERRPDAEPAIVLARDLERAA